MKALLVAASVLLAQQECDIGTMVQGKTTEQFREYFPDAEAMDVIPCVLSIETHVDNVSKRLIADIAQKLFSMPQMRELAAWMEFSGYNYFILGFTNHTIVFDRYLGRWYVFDAVENARFFQTAPNFCAGR